MEMENPNNYNTDVGNRKPYPRNTWRGWFRYFQYNEDSDSPGDVRNVLFVVAALIAAATFQAGVNPPGGVWQADDNGHRAGRAIYASEPEAYYVFLISNTLAFSTSILIVASLTYKFPLQFEIWAATASMTVTYGSAVFAVTPRENVKFRYVLFAAALPLVFRVSIQSFNKLRSMLQLQESHHHHHDPEIMHARY